jgi:hypothetical protein
MNMAEEITVYRVHSLVRSIRNRRQRTVNPGKLRFKQYVMNNSARLVRKRPLTITSRQLEKHLEEFQKKAAAGALEVRSIDGRVLDLSTMKLAAPAPAVVQPHPRPDSVEHDKPAGRPMSAFQDGPPPGDPAATREVERLEDEKKEEAESAGEPPATDGPETGSGKSTKKKSSRKPKK